MRNRFKLNEEEKNRIRGLHGISLITEQPDEEGYVGEGCTDEQRALGLEPIPGGGCGCPPNKSMDENGKCVEGADDTVDDVDDDKMDEELTDEEIEAVENPEDEGTWVAERWEDLTDAVRNIFSKTRRFKACRGKGVCPAFNRTRGRKLRRILRKIRFWNPRLKWPRIKLFKKR